MKVKAVQHIKDYKLKVTFSNGQVRTIDLAAFLKSAINPMTSQFRNIAKFQQVKVEHGHLTWNGEMDLPAETLYQWK